MARRLLLVPLTLVLLAAACGSGDEAPPNTGTATSERVEREATIAEQQETPAQPETGEAEPVQQAQQVQQVQQVQQAQPSAQETEQAQEEVEEEQQIDELPAEIVGVHKGVRSERNVLGEPDAPVEIRYYGDFT